MSLVIWSHSSCSPSQYNKDEDDEEEEVVEEEDDDETIEFVSESSESEQVVESSSLLLLVLILGCDCGRFFLLILRCLFITADSFDAGVSVDGVEGFRNRVLKNIPFLVK